MVTVWPLLLLECASARQWDCTDINLQPPTSDHVYRLTNLNCWQRESSIVRDSLTLFNELASGYSSGKLLVKLDLVNAVLAHHTSNNFPFLDYEANLSNRSLFYTTLGRILLMNENIEKVCCYRVVARQKASHTTLARCNVLTNRLPCISLTTLWLLSVRYCRW
jgi:hypothetical protein